MSGYGGESNAKKLARAAAWQYLTYWGAEGRALFLCGPEGHDVRVALACGWKPEQLVAVDVDGAALAAARAALGSCADGVSFYHGTMLEAAEATDNVTALFFDACEPAVRASKMAAPALARAVARNQHAFTTSRAQLFATRVVFGGMYGRDARWLDEGDTETAADKRRARAVVRDLAKSMEGAVRVFMADIAISYHSRRRCDDGVVRGVPMVYVGGFGCMTDDVGWTQRRVITEHGTVWETLDGRTRRRMVRKKTKANQRTLGSRLRAFGGDLDGAKVKREAVRIAREKGVPQAARLLCLAEGTVRAWLAHDTRGTYGPA